jgi:dihydrodipicolinate synthase/N-acetylneuraminate lyase
MLCRERWVSSLVTGEATSFSAAARIDAMQAIAGSGLPLDRFVVGTGAAALEDAVRLTTEAEALGFAGELLLPPLCGRGRDLRLALAEEAPEQTYAALSSFFRS